MATPTKNGYEFQVVRNEKLSAQISRQLVEAILSGHYAPGDQLPPERDLALMFNTSRVVVREALAALLSKGVLSTRQGRGTSVVSARLRGNFRGIFPTARRPSLLARRSATVPRKAIMPSTNCSSASRRSPARDTNAIVVDVSARMSALLQAHTRYTAARDTSALQLELLQADQNRFASGGMATTFDTLMADQRALVAARISEADALATYGHARVSFDQVLGETLERYNITLDEGLNGHVERQSQIPAVPVSGSSKSGTGKRVCCERWGPWGRSTLRRDGQAVAHNAT